MSAFPQASEAFLREAIRQAAALFAARSEAQPAQEQP